MFAADRVMLQDTRLECVLPRWSLGRLFRAVFTLALHIHPVYHSHIQLAVPSHLVDPMYRLPTLLVQYHHPVLATLLDTQLLRHIPRCQFLRVTDNYIFFVVNFL